MKRKLLGGVMAACLSLVAGFASAATLTTVTNPNGFTSGNWSYGEIFTVGASDLFVTALGAFDDGLDGFVTAGGIQVGIYLESTSALLASVSVQSSDTLNGNFRYQSISTLTLQAGTQYRLVGLTGADNYNLTSGTYSPDATFNSGNYCPSAVLASCNTYTGAGYRGLVANLEYSTVAPSAVPVPASLPLLAGALGGIAAMRRRKKAA